MRWVKIFWLPQLTKELDQRWRLELLLSAQAELSGALGLSLRRTDVVRGDGQKLNVHSHCFAPDVRGALLEMWMVVRPWW